MAAWRRISLPLALERLRQLRHRGLADLAEEIGHDLPHFRIAVGEGGDQHRHRLLRLRTELLQLAQGGLAFADVLVLELVQELPHFLGVLGDGGPRNERDDTQDESSSHERVPFANEGTARGPSFVSGKRFVSIRSNLFQFVSPPPTEEGCVK